MRRHFKTVNYPAWAWRDENPGRTEEERFRYRQMLEEWKESLPVDREEETDGHLFFSKKPEFGPPTECVELKIWETE